MMIATLILIPTLSAGCAFAIRSHRVHITLLVVAATAHALLVASCWVYPPTPAPHDWLGLDAQGLLFLSITSVLFLATSIYNIAYLKTHENREHVYIGCLLLFLGAMTLVTVSQHFGLLWVAVEATTLTSAPLIYINRSVKALEAMWKYLILCSVGIALALLGNFFLVAASAQSESPLVLRSLIEHAPAFNSIWLKATFICFIVGYGTKMGLAPLHSWLPDAHSESPSPVSALLSGALLNCAFLAILRAIQVCIAAGIGDFAREIMLFFGLVSMAFAGVFIVGQMNYKRMLAYSSVEHMGIIGVGIGLGGLGDFGAMFHAVNHSLTKGMLFLISGHILAIYHTKQSAKVYGLIRTLPITGILWVVGFLAITGSPPFGSFLSEFTILQAAVHQGHIGIAIAYLSLLVLVFVGMAGTVFHMAQGDRDQSIADTKLSTLMLAPPLVLGIVALVLGLFLPSHLDQLLHAAAALEPTP